MKTSDFLLNQILRLGPFGILLICAGCFFIGLFVALILVAEKSRVKYTYYASQPWRQKIVIGQLGETPIYGVMYSEIFVRFLWGRLKGSWAKLAAMREIGKI